jgi:hypothetical protein
VAAGVHKRVREEVVERHDVQRLVRGGLEHDRRRHAGLECLGPAMDREAPAVTRHEARESERRQRCREVIARRAREFQELLCHHGAHRMAATVVGPGAAEPVAVETGHRVGATILQRLPEHVGGHTLTPAGTGV